MKRISLIVLAFVCAVFSAHQEQEPCENELVNKRKISRDQRFEEQNKKECENLENKICNQEIVCEKEAQQKREEKCAEKNKVCPPEQIVVINDQFVYPLVAFSKNGKWKKEKFPCTITELQIAKNIFVNGIWLRSPHAEQLVLAKNNEVRKEIITLMLQNYQASLAPVSAIAVKKSGLCVEKVQALLFAIVSNCSTFMKNLKSTPAGKAFLKIPMLPYPCQNQPSRASGKAANCVPKQQNVKNNENEAENREKEAEKECEKNINKINPCNGYLNVAEAEKFVAFMCKVLYDAIEAQQQPCEVVKFLQNNAKQPFNNNNLWYIIGIPVFLLLVVLGVLLYQHYRSE